MIMVMQCLNHSNKNRVDCSELFDFVVKSFSLKCLLQCYIINSVVCFFITEKCPINYFCVLLNVQYLISSLFMVK